MDGFAKLLLGVLAMLVAASAGAQTDEIQVYNGTIAGPGEFELTLHSNYTPVGHRTPDFPGGIASEKSINGAVEFAYGLNPNLELGAYAPVYSITSDGQWVFEGAKLRASWVTANAGEREFFYGVNVEVSWNLPRWSPMRTGAEVRPIVGWRLGAWDLIFNPIFDSNFNGGRQARFAPAERVDYNANARWTYGLELYSDLGELHRFDGVAQETHALFGVVDFAPNPENSIELGLGRGLTSATDQWVVKLILNHSF